MRLVLLNSVVFAFLCDLYIVVWDFFYFLLAGSGLVVWYCLFGLWFAVIVFVVIVVMVRLVAVCLLVCLVCVVVLGCAGGLVVWLLWLMCCGYCGLVVRVLGGGFGVVFCAKMVWMHIVALAVLFCYRFVCCWLVELRR